MCWVAASALSTAWHTRSSYRTSPPTTPTFARDALGRVAVALGVTDAGQGLFDLLGVLGLPASLASLGIRPEAVDEIVRITLETDHGNNPGPVDAAGVLPIVEAALAGRRPGPDAQS